MLGNLGAKLNLYFIYLCTPPVQKAFPCHRASEGTRVGAQALETHQHIFLRHLKTCFYS